MQPPQHFPVIGVPVAATTREAVAELIATWAVSSAEQQKAYGVAAADAHVIARGRHEADFRNSLAKFDCICPDGMPLVWTINSQLTENQPKLKERVSGANILERCLEKSRTNQKLVHFFLGGSEKLLGDLQAHIEKNYTGATVASYYSPPFGEWPATELPKIFSLIRDSGANMIWVGLGCPKQERWIGDNYHQLPPGVYLSVGAAFAFHAGHIDRAPDWVQRAGLEWLYRILKEPKRLWKRYFTYNSLFIYYWFRDKILSKPALEAYAKLLSK